MAKNETIRVRIDDEDLAMVNELRLRTGLIKSELMRKALRLLYLEAKRRGETGILMEELNPNAVEATINSFNAPRFNEPAALKKQGK